VTDSSVPNQAIFNFTLTPPLFNLNQNLMDNMFLQGSVPLSISNATYKAGQLLVYVDFSQDIEGVPASFTFNLSGALPKSSNTINFIIVKTENMS
jgi:hypothetical protein